LVNAFCVREAGDAVLDPACGSGSFLVRAYYRKRWLCPQKPHADLLSELFGCDIALYPAHLATLNLAAREINDEANYPQITRKDFFDIEPDETFCELPPHNTEILLPRLGAVVGNPPYVRQEKIGSDEKGKISRVISSRWPGLRLSGRADIHCYFWPAAAALLREGGYFGFLTSSSWLDVEYGFALQRWILQNFKLIGVLESTAEPWFPDARIKTCVTVLQRCNDAAERTATLVKFVRVKRPLAEVIGRGADELEARFEAVDGLRKRIEETTEDCEDESLRVVVKRQQDLWNEGLRAARVLAKGIPIPETGEDEEDEEDEETTEESTVAVRADSAKASGKGAGEQITVIQDYAAGKWGRYLRAPGFYFDVMREFGSRFVPLGEIAEIRRGITSGCDAFFMPRDVTAEALERSPGARDFKHRCGVDREAVVDGRVKIVRAGDGSEHPIEAEYVEPEIHSLMTLDRPLVKRSDTDRVVVLVGGKPDAPKGNLVAKYLRFGETQTFSSGKSKAVPVPKRSTCAARTPWYDLTALVNPGFAFWPKATQYRHIAFFNLERLITNCRLYDIAERPDCPVESEVLTAILNSTVVALWRHFYGRYTGTEGSLDTMVLDLNLLEVPDPRFASREMNRRVIDAFRSLSERKSGQMVEEQLMECHSPEKAAAIGESTLVLSEELRQADRRELDDAVFELLGVADAGRRKELVDSLYAATADHFRQIRIVEIQKMEQRSKSKAHRFTTQELASDAWDAVYYKDLAPLSDWLATWPGPTVTIAIPNEGAARLLDERSMFDRETVYFGKDRGAAKIVCASRAQAELIARLAELSIRGDCRVPEMETDCREMLNELDKRATAARVEFETIASNRVSDEKAQAEIVGLMMQWFVQGKPAVGTRVKPDTGIAAEAEAE
jgi:Eco57I restriction-modification methylase